MLTMVIAGDSTPCVQQLGRWKHKAFVLLEIVDTPDRLLALLNSKQPDLLLVEQSFCSFEGENMAELVRAQNATVRLVLFGQGEMQAVQLAFRLQAADYLFAPFTQQAFCRTLDRVAVQIEQQRNARRERLQQRRQAREREQELRRIGLRFLLECVLQNPPSATTMGQLPHRAAKLLNEPCAALQICLGMQGGKQVKDAVRQRLIETVRQELAFFYSDVLWRVSDEGIFFLLLGYRQDKQALMYCCDTLRHRFLSREDVPRATALTIVVGDKTEHIDVLSYLLSAMRVRALDRIFLGLGAVLEVGEVDGAEALPEVVQMVLDEQGEASLQQMRSCFAAVKEKIREQTESGLVLHKTILFLFSHYAGQILSEHEMQRQEQDKKELLSALYICTSPEQAIELLQEKLEAMHQSSIDRLKSREIEPVQFARQYILQHFANQIRVQDIAKLVGFSYTYFSYLFKKETGLAMTDYIQSVRIEAAKKLLLSREKKVSEVSELVGYSDVKFFGQQFKKRVGKSPYEYQKAALARKEEQ